MKKKMCGLTFTLFLHAFSLVSVWTQDRKRHFTHCKFFSKKKKEKWISDVNQFRGHFSNLSIYSIITAGLADIFTFTDYCPILTVSRRPCLITDGALTSMHPMQTCIQSGTPWNHSSLFARLYNFKCQAFAQRTISSCRRSRKTSSTPESGYLRILYTPCAPQKTHASSTLKISSSMDGKIILELLLM